MKYAFLILLSSLAVTLAGFSEGDRYVVRPEILAGIIAAGQRYGRPLASSKIENTSYYLQCAEYIGPCTAPFGIVHVARLSFFRSGPNDSKLPARGHTFIVFLDHKLTVRSYWEVDFGFGHLDTDGTTVSLDGKLIFDYSHRPQRNEIVIDGTVQDIPRWK